MGSLHQMAVPIRTKVFIGNLSDDITEEDLRSLLTQYGKMIECTKLINFGFAHFTSPEEADAACRNLDGAMLKGMKLAVKISRSSSRGVGGGSAGGSGARSSFNTYPAQQPNHSNGPGPMMFNEFHSGVEDPDSVIKTKVYVGNLSESVTEIDLRQIMHPYGAVTECVKLGNYAFVHFDNPGSASKVCHLLNRTHLKGTMITVQISHSSGRKKPGGGGMSSGILPPGGEGGSRFQPTGFLPSKVGGGNGESGVICFQCGGKGHVIHDCNMRRPSMGGGAQPARTKIHIGNLAEGTTRDDLWPLLERQGPVLECDVLSHYAFAHYVDTRSAQRACQELDKIMFKGTQIRVQLSRSSVRPKPGMGMENTCFHCGDPGHWSKNCPVKERQSGSGHGEWNARALFPGGHDRQPPSQFQQHQHSQQYVQRQQQQQPFQEPQLQSFQNQQQNALDSHFSRATVSYGSDGSSYHHPSGPSAASHHGPSDSAIAQGPEARPSTRPPHMTATSVAPNGPLPQQHPPSFSQPRPHYHPPVHSIPSSISAGGIDAAGDMQSIQSTVQATAGSAISSATHTGHNAALGNSTSSGFPPMDKRLLQPNQPSQSLQVIGQGPVVGLGNLVLSQHSHLSTTSSFLPGDHLNTVNNTLRSPQAANTHHEPGPRPLAHLATTQLAAANPFAASISPNPYHGNPSPAMGVAYGGTPSSAVGSPYGRASSSAIGIQYGGASSSAIGVSYGGTPSSAIGAPYGGTSSSAIGAPYGGTSSLGGQFLSISPGTAASSFSGPSPTASFKAPSWQPSGNTGFSTGLSNVNQVFGISEPTLPPSQPQLAVVRSGLGSVGLGPGLVSGVSGAGSVGAVQQQYQPQEDSGYATHAGVALPISQQVSSGRLSSHQNLSHHLSVPSAHTGFFGPTGLVSDALIWGPMGFNAS